MSYAFEGLSVVLTLLLAVVGFLLLWIRTAPGERIRTAITRLLDRVTGRSDLGWLSWWHLAAIAAVVYAGVVGFNVVTGAYACPGGGQESDLIGFLNSGRALLAGRNPFTVGDCGGTIPEPYGFASILISAVGSPAGIPGIAFVWGVVTVAVVPLVWRVAGPDRRYLTIFVLASPLYLPLVVTQIDGASNALIPFTVLAGLALASRGEWIAGVVGGFLSTGRFPALFPVVASFGPTRRRWTGAFIAIAVFGAVTAVTFAIWRAEFLDVVFFSQIGRRSFSLNFYEVLQQGNLLPGGSIVPVVQALLTVAVVVVAFFRARTGLWAAAFTLTAVTLLTQYLSFNLLVCLLPVALVQVRARWWFWAIGVVGALNYDVAYSDWAVVGGVYWPTEILDVVLTVLLLGLLVDLWRVRAAEAPGDPPAGAGRIAASVR